jgi:hypothetical protein
MPDAEASGIRAIDLASVPQVERRSTLAGRAAPERWSRCSSPGVLLTVPEAAGRAVHAMASDEAG